MREMEILSTLTNSLSKSDRSYRRRDYVSGVGNLGISHETVHLNQRDLGNLLTEKSDGLIRRI